MPISPAQQSPAAISVSELNRMARVALDSTFEDIWVEGELSNVSRPASGHVYFTLKDDDAQVRCALFRQRARFVAAPMRDGDQVRLRARVSLFEPRGDYQLIVEAVQAAGIGDLLAAYERLKHRLDGEGVFANQRPLAYPPRRLLVMTSPSGAAIRDLMAVLARRWPLIDASLIPVPVQGRQAAPAIIAGLALLNRQARLDPARDLILLTRGGGSLEDLWAFNDEHLARAIHLSRLPVMSAIGHEVDTALSDLAADASAPTPSAAAERLVPDQHDVRHRLKALETRLAAGLQHRLQADSQRLDALSARLRHPDEQLTFQRRALDALNGRLARAFAATFTRHQGQLAQLEKRLVGHDLNRRQAQEAANLDALSKRLSRAMRQALTRERTRLNGLSRELDAISPLGVLARGYAIAQDEQGRVLRRAANARPGQTLTLRLGEGALAVEVSGHCADTGKPGR